MAAFFLFLSTGAVFRCIAQTPKGFVVRSETAHSSVNEESLARQIGFLSDSLCGGRATGSTGGTEAAMWIERNFRANSLLPLGNGYSWNFSAGEGLVGKNIVGMLPAAGNNPGRGYVIVFAHYDGLGILDGQMYPGADDNASGIAAMLGTVRMFNTMLKYRRSYRRNIIFAATDAKNMNMGGVKALWELLTSGQLRDPLHGNAINREDIALTVNIDQIGSTLSPIHSGKSDYIIMLSDSRDGYYKGELRLASGKYGIDMDLGFDYYGSRAFTDMFYRTVSEQKIFIDNKIPSVMFTSGITMNNNKVWDVPETLDMSVLKKRTWLIFHWLERSM